MTRRLVNTLVIFQTGFALECLATIRAVQLFRTVSLLVLLDMFRIDKGCRAKAARIRFFSLVLGVNVTVKEPLSAKLGAAVAAGIPSFSQVNVPNVSVQVLLLVEPCSADIALKRFFPRVNPPAVVELKVARKLLSTHLALPGAFHPVHRALVDCEGIVVVDDNLAERAADGRLGLRLVLLFLHLVLVGGTHVVDPLVFEKEGLGEKVAIALYALVILPSSRQRLLVWQLFRNFFSFYRPDLIKLLTLSLVGDHLFSVLEASFTSTALVDC